MCTGCDSPGLLGWKLQKKKGACEVIHERSRLPMTYLHSLALLPLENGTLGNTQLSCRPYQIKGSLPRKKNALFTEF